MQTPTKTVSKITNFAKDIALKSAIQIARHDIWEQYINPLFNKKFGRDYDSSLHNMYGGEIKTFLNWHKSRFQSKISELYILYSKFDESVINNTSEELDDSINKDDYYNVLDNAATYTLEEAKSFANSYELDYEEDKLLIKPFFLIN